MNFKGEGNLLYVDILLRLTNGDTPTYLHNQTGLSEKVLKEVLLENKTLETLAAVSRIRAKMLRNAVYTSLVRAPYKAIMLRQKALSEFLCLERNDYSLFDIHEGEGSWQINLVEVYNRIITLQSELLGKLMGDCLPANWDISAYYNLNLISTASELEAEVKRANSKDFFEIQGNFFGEDHLIISRKGVHDKKIFEFLLARLGIQEESLTSIYIFEALLEEVELAIRRREEINGTDEDTSVSGEQQHSREEESQVREENTVSCNEQESETVSCTKPVEEEDTKTVSCNSEESSALSLKDTVVSETQDSLKVEGPLSVSLTSDMKPTASAHLQETEPEVGLTASVEGTYDSIIYVDCDNVSKDYIRVLSYIDKLSKENKVLVKLYIDKAEKEMWSNLKSKGNTTFKSFLSPRILNEKSMVDIFITEALVRDRLKGTESHTFTEFHIISSDSDFGALSTLGYNLRYAYSSESSSTHYIDFLKEKGAEVFDVMSYKEEELILSDSVKDRLVDVILQKMTTLSPAMWNTTTIAHHLKIDTESSSLFVQLGTNQQVLFDVIEEVLPKVKVEYVQDKGMVVTLKEPLT